MKIMKNSRETGNIGENFAHDYLEKDGYRVICRNFNGKHGEIDIIAEKDAYIVFTEVKLRKMLSQKPCEAVDHEKMMHILNTAQEFLCEYGEYSFISDMSLRFDLIEIQTANTAVCSYRHVENIYCP